MSPPRGRLFGLGVGPGDPELLTLKAARLLRAVPVVAYPAPDRASASPARSSPRGSKAIRRRLRSAFLCGRSRRPQRSMTMRRRRSAPNSTAVVTSHFCARAIRSFMAASSICSAARRTISDRDRPRRLILDRLRRRRAPPRVARRDLNGGPGHPRRKRNRRPSGTGRGHGNPQAWPPRCEGASSAGTRRSARSRGLRRTRHSRDPARRTAGLHRSQRSSLFLNGVGPPPRRPKPGASETTER